MYHPAISKVGTCIDRRTIIEHLLSSLTLAPMSPSTGDVSFRKVSEKAVTKVANLSRRYEGRLLAQISRISTSFLNPFPLYRIEGRGNFANEHGWGFPDNGRALQVHCESLEDLRKMLFTKDYLVKL